MQVSLQEFVVFQYQDLDRLTYKQGKFAVVKKSAKVLNCCFLIFILRLLSCLI